MLPSGGSDDWPHNLAAYNRTCRQSTNQNTDENIVPGYPPIPQQAHVIRPSFATPSHMNSACTPSHHVQCHANYPASAWRQNNSIHSQHVRPITNQHSTHCAAQFPMDVAWQTQTPQNFHAVAAFSCNSMTGQPSAGLPHYPTP